MKRLFRLLRIMVGLGVLCGAVYAFVGAESGPSALQPLLMSQFGPALLRVLRTASLGALITVSVLAVVTLVAGRVYCAALCPLGVLQDVFRRVGRIIPPLRRRQDRPAGQQAQTAAAIRLAVLGFVVVTGLLGSFALCDLLEPYSAFGRLATSLLLPATIGIRRLLAFGLEHMDIYALSGSRFLTLTPSAVIGAAVTLLALAVLSAGRGRVFCTHICPVGTVLGWLSRFALVKVRVDADSCTTCGLCAKRCRSHCITVEKGGEVHIDASACVMCLDCLTVCPADSTRLGTGRGTRAPAGMGTAVSRREAVTAGIVCAGAAAALPVRGPVVPRLPGMAGDGATPPGSISRERFVNACTACHLCVAACPTGVLRPAVLEYGIRGVLQPVLSYRDGYCEYDCTACSNVCPTGAILPLTEAAKHTVCLGIAKLHRERCVVYLRGEECGACAEVCPTHAVYTEERDGILFPEMDEPFCIGCGACENVCPQDPRAIVVEVQPVHTVAEDPYADDDGALDDGGLDWDDGGDDGDGELDWENGPGAIEGDNTPTADPTPDDGDAFPF